jgi:hypothetical protein
MTTHLRPEEIVDALEASLTADRARHLEDCAECRSAVAELRDVAAEAARVDVPEPSPLFWDHFAQRVRAATNEAVAPVRTWWTAWGRSAALVGAIGAVLLIAALQPTAPVEEATTLVDGEPAFSLGVGTDDVAWGLVVGMATELDVADVRAIVKPAEGTADAMLADLTPEQRAEFVRLLQQEMGES